jgi:hypothetical protein
MGGKIFGHRQVGLSRRTRPTSRTWRLGAKAGRAIAYSRIKGARGDGVPAPGKIVFPAKAGIQQSLPGTGLRRCYGVAQWVNLRLPGQN